MMEERNESDRVPKDRFPLSNAGVLMEGSSFLMPWLPARAIILLALAAAYCFSTVFVFGMVAAAYGSLASTDAKQKVGLLVLFCMKLAISVGFPFR